MDEGVRRTGLWLGSIASGLWLVVAALLYAGRGGGADVLVLVTAPLSVASGITLVVAWSTARRRGEQHSAEHTAGAVLAGIGAGLLLFVLAVAPAHVLAPSVTTGLLTGGVVAFFASVCLSAAPPSNTVLRR